MQNLIFFRLIAFIVKFLSDLTEGKTQKKDERFYIPVNLISRYIDCSINEINDIISEKEIGLEIIEDPEKIKQIKDFLLEFDSKFNKNTKHDSEFKSALEIMESYNSTNPNTDLENTEDSDKLKHELTNGIFKGELLDSDFANGLVYIKSIPLFAEISSKYEDWDKILRIFDWKKFEDFIAVIIQNFGYRSMTNFRFSLAKKSRKKSTVVSKTTKKLQKRFEVDVLAIKENEILFIDAKYWKLNSDHGSPLSSAGTLQSERAKLFCQDKEAIRKYFENLSISFQNRQIQKIKDRNLNKKKSGKGRQETNLKFDKIASEFWVYPIVVYAGVSEKKINFTGVPIVSINDFSDFIQNFHANKFSFIRYKIKKIEFQSHLN